VSYEITVVEMPRRPTLVVQMVTPVADLGQRFLEHLPRVCDVAIAQGARLAGPPFVRYLGGDTRRVHVEFGIIVAADATPTGDVIAAELPAGPAARTIHTGHYDTLGDAHDALVTWTTRARRVASGPPIELYVSDPYDSDDPTGWRTEVLLPLAAG
jgi:effector-binding domain-containing protein